MQRFTHFLVRRSRPRVLALLLSSGLSLIGMRAAPVLPVSANNSALRLTVSAVTTGPSYGATTARAGHQFVVLAASWENRIDPKLAAARGLATAYLLEDLSKHLYLVMDGQALGELRGQLHDKSGRVSLDSVKLDKPGAKLNGDVVYELPAGAPQSLDLRFYDDTTGYFSMALGGPAPVAAPVSPLQKNAVAEVGIYRVENPAKSVVPPSGFRAMAVELRARSLWQIDGEVSAYDASQPAGSIAKHINLLDWTDTRKYIHLLVDGVYAYPPEETSTLPAAPRFIPEFMTGGRLLFLIPADAHEVELFCEMPHAAAPGSDVIDLPPMRFPVIGTAGETSALKPVLAIQDEMFAITVDRARRMSAFAGEKAGEGKQFVVLSMSVINQGQTGEFFQPRDQLLLGMPDGSELGMDESTAKGAHRPEEQIHLPAGSRRQFEIAYQTEATATPQLSFHGGSFMKAYELPLEK